MKTIVNNNMAHISPQPRDSARTPFPRCGKAASPPHRGSTLPSRADRRSGTRRAAGHDRTARANGRLACGAALERAALLARATVAALEHAARALRAGRGAVVVEACEAARAARTARAGAVRTLAVAADVVALALHVARARVAAEIATRAAFAGTGAIGAGAAARGAAGAGHVARRTVAEERAGRVVTAQARPIAALGRAGGVVALALDVAGRRAARDLAVLAALAVASAVGADVLHVVAAAGKREQQPREAKRGPRARRAARSQSTATTSHGKLISSWLASTCSRAQASPINSSVRLSRIRQPCWSS
jgi:hypothetical protein